MALFGRSNSQKQRSRSRPLSQAERDSIIQQHEAHNIPPQEERGIPDRGYQDQDDSEQRQPLTQRQQIRQVRDRDPQQCMPPTHQQQSYMPGQYAYQSSQGYSAVPAQAAYQQPNYQQHPAYQQRPSQDLPSGTGGQYTARPTQSSHSQHTRPYSHQSRPSRDEKEYNRTSVASAATTAGFNRNNSRAQARNKKNDDRKQRGKPGSTVKDHLIAISGEFVGTLLFLWFAFAVHQMATDQAGQDAIRNAATPSSQTIVVISLGYGFALLVAAWNFFRVSGGLFNPAVTLGLCAAGQLPWIRGVLLVPFQLLGAICAAALVRVMFPGNIQRVDTTLAPNVSTAQGLFIEMFLTTLLVYTVLMLAAEKTRVTPMAPLGIGLALFIAELAGVYYTGGSLNPARSFGPCVAGAYFQSYHWIYWLGPSLGALLAAGYYRLIKAFNYEEANPGQDDVTDDEDGDDKV